MTEQHNGAPLVSVVIPAYLCSKRIARSLESVLAQTYRNFEILLVNDGSPDIDALEAALAPYATRIRYLKQENRGPGGARNAGILASHGKYVAFLDSDDAWLPGHLAQQVAMLQADSALDLVYADSILMEGDNVAGHAFGSEPQAPTVTFEALLTEACTIATSSAVVRIFSSALLVPTTTTSKGAMEGASQKPFWSFDCSTAAVKMRSMPIP
jgi:glycosyltransferase involved in cell wall biosynthesis